jgi:5-methylcytosine-specific restriction endonuclease McrA
MANWNHNLSSAWKKRFRKKVALRFGYISWQEVKCSKCKKKANEKHKRIMEVHHVYASIEYPELRICTENVIPLCNYCHDRFHKRFDIRVGRFVIKVATAEDLQIFLRIKAMDILNTIE